MQSRGAGSSSPCTRSHWRAQPQPRLPVSTSLPRADAEPLSLLPWKAAVSRAHPCRTFPFTGSSPLPAEAAAQGPSSAAFTRAKLILPPRTALWTAHGLLCLSLHPLPAVAVPVISHDSVEFPCTKQFVSKDINTNGGELMLVS